MVAYVEEYSNTDAASPPFAIGASTGRIAVCFPGTSLIPVTLDVDGSFESDRLICTAPCPWMDTLGNVFVVFSAAPTTADDDVDRVVWLAVWLGTNRGSPDFLEQVDVLNGIDEAGNFPSVAGIPVNGGDVAHGIVIWRKYNRIGTTEEDSQIVERRFYVDTTGIRWDPESMLSERGYIKGSDPAILATESGEYLAAYAATERPKDDSHDPLPLSIYVRKLDEWGGAWGPQYRVEADNMYVLCKYPQLAVGPSGERFFMAYEAGPEEKRDLDGDGDLDPRSRGIRCAWALVSDVSAWGVLTTTEGVGGGSSIDPQGDPGDLAEVVPGSGTAWLYESDKNYEDLEKLQSVNPCIVPFASFPTHDHFRVFFTNLDLDKTPFALSLLNVAGVTT